jgi:signal transduction histidine kinase
MINLNHKIDILRHELDIQKKINQELKEKLTLIETKAIQNDYSQKVSSLIELLNNIGHHWRQPLSAISSGATTLSMFKELNILDDEFFFETCNSIEKSSQYLSDTISEFSNFFAKQQKQIQFDLKNNINSFINLVKNETNNSHINIKLDLHKNHNTYGYPNGLIQCFLSLFNNAKDALIKNNDHNNRFIFISENIINNKIIIKFKDNAGGIDDSMLCKIFEPYFTTKHKSMNTGLGLTMCYIFIVNSMQGTITVENKKFKLDDKMQHGAEFTITFPLLQEEEHANL